ncbi:MAG: GNAT family N-acetyltransferase [Pseudomonadota bacterium]
MLRPLQQHPHFADCLRAGGRHIIETEHGNILLRRFASLKVGLISRGSRAMLSAPVPRLTTRIFNAEEGFGGPLSQNGYWQLRSGIEIAEWSLDGPLPDLAKAMRKTWRHALNRAEDASLKISVTTMPSTSNHWLLEAEQAQARARGYTALPLWITRAWATLHPKDAVLIEARRKGELAGGMVFLRHGKVATYHISHATALGKETDAHRAMLWRAATHFKMRGVSRIDLGTLDQEAAPGLASFKLGTGAQARKLGGTWLSLPGIARARRHWIRHTPTSQNA